jgi:hypothetical protein
VDREPMSDLDKRLREAAQEVAAEGHFGWGNRMQIAADRIEELERALSECAAPFIIGDQDGIRHEEIAREFNRRQRVARAVLERGEQPSAAESVGEEIENVAIVTRTVRAGQGRVEGEP